MIYALDFDGVIVDSLNECLETSFAAFLRVNQKSNSIYFDSPPVDAIYHFKKKRGFVRPSRNFFALWEWILFHPERNFSMTTFESFSESLGSVVDDFEKEFLQIRSNAIKLNPLKFLEQNPLFYGVKETWQNLPKPLYIVSTKDEDSISLILESHSLTVDGIFGRGSGPKAETLSRLANLNETSVNDVFFVDDNIQHAHDVTVIGAKVALAMWGYGPFEKFMGSKLQSFTEVLEFFSDN